MDEVRRCSGCGEAAAVCVRAWGEERWFGLIPTGRTPRRDFVCQSCGAGFAVEPWRMRLFAGLTLGPLFTFQGLLFPIGALFIVVKDPLLALLLIGSGAAIASLALVFVAWATRPARVARNNPVVPGAPPPLVRYRLTEPVRRCGCGQPVACSGVKARRVNGLPSGTEYSYVCGHCGRSFVIEDALGQLFTGFASTVALGLGGLLLWTARDQGPGGWACASAITLLGLGGWALTVARFLARFRFPELPQPSLGGKLPP